MQYMEKLKELAGAGDLSQIHTAVSGFCWMLSKILPTRTIKVFDDPYLLRVYLSDRVRLHYFYIGDDDRSVHNHPWDNSTSVILTGGYREERYDPATKATTFRDLRPGDVNHIAHKDFHRVDLLDEGKGCWTLFITGTRIQDWGFHDRKTGVYTPHAEYVEERYD